MGLTLARDYPEKPFNSYMERFHPKYWTIDYNALMVATILPVNERGFVVSGQWRTNSDFLGVRWDSEDRFDHEWFKYATDNSYRDSILAFRANTPEPWKFTCTLTCFDVPYTYRLSPYVFNEETQLWECLDPQYGTGKTYPKDVMWPKDEWFPIPNDPDTAVTMFKERDDYIFILDFNDIRLYSLYNGPLIETTNIARISFDTVEWSHGLGRQTAVIDMKPVGNKVQLDLSGVLPGARLAPGDKLQVLWRYYNDEGYEASREDVFVVESYTGFGTSSYSVICQGSMYGYRFLGSDSMYSRYLAITSPAEMTDSEKYFVDMKFTGNRTTVAVRDYPQPRHDLHMTSGFDDGYNVTPERQVEMAAALGYNGPWTTYIGMSHYFNARTAYMDIVTGEVITPPRLLDMTVLYAGQSQAAIHFLYGTAPDRGVDAFVAEAARLFGRGKGDFFVINGATGSTAADRASAVNPNSDVFDPEQAAGAGGLWWWDLEADEPGPAMKHCMLQMGTRKADAIIWSQGDQDAVAIEFPDVRDPKPAIERSKRATQKVFEYFRKRFGDKVQIFIQEQGWSWTEQAPLSAPSTPMYLTMRSVAATAPPPTDPTAPPVDPGVDTTFTWLSYKSDPAALQFVLDILDVTGTGAIIRSIPAQGVVNGLITATYTAQQMFADFGYPPMFLAYKVRCLTTGTVSTNEAGFITLNTPPVRYPFDPATLPVPGSTDQPQSVSFQQKIAVRNMQAELIAQYDWVHFGAPTAQYTYQQYRLEPGLGYIHFSQATARLIGKDLAQHVFDWYGVFPVKFGLTKGPNDYYFIGQLYPFEPDQLDPPVNKATMDWYRRFFKLLAENDFYFINSVAYEILDFFMPEAWKQRTWKGAPAQSGWYPPSSFIQPTNQVALNYVSQVQIQIIQAMIDAGITPRFQIGEPWWWDGSYNLGESHNSPCIYDAATLELYHAETGLYAPTPWIKDIFQTIDPIQWPFVDWLCDKLGQSTNQIRDNVKAVFPDAQATLLFFTPQIMSPSSELTKRLNFPVEYWKTPNYDFVQIEDYDWIINGDLDLVPLTFDAAAERLGYPRSVVHYFTGFILKGQDYHIWPWIDKAIRMAKEANMPYIYVWSYTQAIRDSILYNNLPPEPLKANILDLPPNWKSEYQVTRTYKTEVITSRGGKEQRRAMRRTPRKTVEFTSHFKGDDARRFDAFMIYHQGYPFYVPDLVQWTRLATDLVAGQITVTLQKVPAWIQLGTVVILSRPAVGNAAASMIAVVVDKIAGNKVDFLAPTSDGQTYPAGSRLYYSMYCSFGANMGTRRLTSTVAEIGFSLDVVPGSEPPPWHPKAASFLWQNAEVFPLRPNWSKDIDSTFTSPVESVDYGQGLVNVFNPVQFNGRTMKFTYLSRNLTDTDAVLGFFERMKGRQGVFWTPTWQADMVLDPRTVPGNVIYVKGTEIADYLARDTLHNNIAATSKVDGTISLLKVVSAARADDHTTGLVLDGPVSQGWINSTGKMSWLLLCRLTTDTLTISYLTDTVAQFELSMTALQTADSLLDVGVIPTLPGTGGSIPLNPPVSESSNNGL